MSLSGAVASVYLGAGARALVWAMHVIGTIYYSDVRIGKIKGCVDRTVGQSVSQLNVNGSATLHFPDSMAEASGGA